MKSLLILSILSSFCLAIPKVGQLVEYNYSTSPIESKNDQIRIEVLTVDDEAKSVVEKMTQLKNGQVVGQHDLIKTFDSYINTGSVKLCNQIGGSMRWVTVPAGPYFACMVMQDKPDFVQTIWYSDLKVMAFVKLVHEDKILQSKEVFELARSKGLAEEPIEED